jgi:hypothetical protein
MFKERIQVPGSSVELRITVHQNSLLLFQHQQASWRVIFEYVKKGVPARNKFENVWGDHGIRSDCKDKCCIWQRSERKKCFMYV